MLLRENARGLWGGTMDFFDFYQSMMLTITRGFNQAWEEGMQKFGMSLSDQTPEERSRLMQEIQHETAYIEGVADFIAVNSKANGGKLATCMQRIELWVAAYTRIVQLATAMAGKDKPLKWTIDAPKESCNSCLRLNGKVKRASYWYAHVTPKSWDLLECDGGCKCSLEPTTDPLSKGPLPHLP
jgi:hypothetical protein